MSFGQWRSRSDAAPIERFFQLLAVCHTFGTVLVPLPFTLELVFSFPFSPFLLLLTLLDGDRGSWNQATQSAHQLPTILLSIFCFVLGGLLNGLNF